MEELGGGGGGGGAFVWGLLPSVMQEADQDPGELPVSCHLCQ